jgi:hypothetical protein
MENLDDLDHFSGKCDIDAPQLMMELHPDKLIAS